MKKNNPTVACSTCRGTGQVDLDRKLASVLSLFKGTKRLSALDVQSAICEELQTSALNNRLEKLRRHGLLDREKSSRQWLYFLPKTA